MSHLPLHHDLLAQVKRHEGWRAEPYKDSEGHWTVGYGHLLLVPVPFPIPLSETHGEVVLRDDLEVAWDLAQRMEYYRALSETRKAVIVEMVFNLGFGKFIGFKRMNAALTRHDYQLASEEMLDSKWATQVKSRATTLAGQMRTGVYSL